MSLLNIEKFSFSYNKCDNVIEDVSFSVEEGELVLLCGGTGSGKTTLLSCLKPEISPCGQISGKIEFCGSDLRTVPKSVSAAEIGYVMQRPESQIVTHKVWHELAFGLENLGLDKQQIYRQIAEITAFFSLDKILDSDTATLSGGEKQLLNLASVLAMKPRMILLDEPTAQLDPVAAGEFIRTLHRLTRELAVTVIISEHKIEQLLALADKVIFLEDGKQVAFSSPIDCVNELADSKFLRYSVPSGIRLYNRFIEERDALPPITLSESRKFLRKLCGNIVQPEITPDRKKGVPILSIKDIHFTYSFKNDDIIKGLDLEVYEGEVLSILGSNGTGKSTLLSLIAGILTPYRGKIELFGKKLKEFDKKDLYSNKLAVLPQDVRSTFLYDTVGEELQGDLKTTIYDFTKYAHLHPYDLSGGQQQLLAFGKILRKKPQLLLLDEPTKGLDGVWSDYIVLILHSLRARGITTINVTHDVEFAAVCSDRCTMFFNGRTDFSDVPHKFFCGNLYYSTDSARISEGYFNGVCTYKKLIEICDTNMLEENANRR